MDLSMPAGTPAPLTPLQRLTALYMAGGYGRQSAQLAADLLAKHDAGKDIRGAAQAPADASTLGSAVLDILTALAELIEVPFPGDAPDAERLYYRLLERRTWGAISVIRGLVERDGNWPEWVTGHLAEVAARNPVTYPVAARRELPAAGGEQA